MNYTMEVIITERERRAIRRNSRPPASMSDKIVAAVDDVVCISCGHTTGEHGFDCQAKYPGSPRGPGS